MSDSIFDKVEEKSKVKREDILKLAKEVSGSDLTDEDNLRSLIKRVASMAGREVSEEKTEQIISAVKKDKIPKDFKKVI